MSAERNTKTPLPKNNDGERKSKVRPISFQATVGETGEQKSEKVTIFLSLNLVNFSCVPNYSAQSDGESVKVIQLAERRSCLNSSSAHRLAFLCGAF